jgi:thioredoxin reductase (NADPH)
VDRAWIPQIDRRKCTACGDCIARCPTGALGLVTGKAAVIHADACSYSAICEAVCPVGAIELPYLIRWDDGNATSQDDS